MRRFPGALFALTFALSAQAAETADVFGYASPQEAYSAVKARPGVVAREEGGWLLLDDKPNYTLWSFTPAGHPAHPAAVKRAFVKAPNGDISIVMTAKCGGPKAACDKVIEDFKVLNEKLRQSMKPKRDAD